MWHLHWRYPGNEKTRTSWTLTIRIFRPPGNGTRAETRFLKS